MICCCVAGVANAWITDSDFNDEGQLNSAETVVAMEADNCGESDVAQAAVESPSSSASLSGASSNKKTYTVKGVSFTMLRVDGGTFQMGSNDGEYDEKPVHSVTLNSYQIGQTEVTQALWKAVMGNNPSWFKGDDLPVERVSWNDCQDFIAKLNQMTGEAFRLPTEAEWEFAAKGGNKGNGATYSGSDNLYDVAWYASNSSSKTHAVGTKAPNELGIYDMSGNVQEWCHDRYVSYANEERAKTAGQASGSGRVYRGGSWLDNAMFCRTANRSLNAPSFTHSNLGLRLAR